MAEDRIHATPREYTGKTVCGRATADVYLAHHDPAVTCKVCLRRLPDVRAEEAKAHAAQDDLCAWAHGVAVLSQEDLETTIRLARSDDWSVEDLHRVKGLMRRLGADMVRRGR